MDNASPLKTYTRVCPKCGKETTHKSAQACRQAEKYQFPCRECADESVRQTTRDPAWRSAHSESLCKAWADPESTLNSKAYRQTLSDSQTRRWKNCSPAEKERLNRLHVQQWKDNHDEWSAAIRLGCNTLEHKKALSDGLQKYWDNATPDIRQRASDCAKKLMLDPDHKRRCTEKMIEAAQRTSGQSKQELALAVLLAPRGFIHHYKIGRWWVDFYNPQTDSVIEYFGDWWHVHPRFYRLIETKYGGIHPNHHKTIQEILDHDRSRLEDVQKAVQNVTVLWENDLRIKYSRSDPKMWFDPDCVYELLGLKVQMSKDAPPNGITR